ncbi:rhamnogalacturonan acetylesterase [Lapidilactobacillus bayanensis]|uniref:rhamnogalacturonan acetylesterase n=1 Tax=Lapidilactobacillus bayanensis TaxID=2485998 RepID=UPI001CDD3066|nr:rhamnogalacturonan acetylesterase [Lapidilactobacillus bayanensis]
MHTIYIAGDSTAATKSSEARPETGWGEYLQEFFDPTRIRIVNMAKNGRSTKSFIAEGRLTTIDQIIQPQDYLFIQFGHNDQKLEDTERGTHPDSDFQENLHQFIAVARQHHATPVLLTSFTRRQYLPNSDKIDATSLGRYPEAMKYLAAKDYVLLLDLNMISRDFLNQQSITETAKYFLHLKPGEFLNYPDGRNDDAHSSPLGARINAELVARAIQDSNIELSQDLLLNK